MAEIWKDGFDHYGGKRDRLLQGAWAALEGDTMTPTVPAFGARTGDYCVRLSGTPAAGFNRRVFGSSVSVVIVGEGVYLPELPNVDGALYLFGLLSISNEFLFGLYVRADGALEVRLAEGAPGNDPIASTAGPALVAGTWTHVETKVDRPNGTVEVRVNEVTVLQASGLALGSTDYAQLALNNGATQPFFVDDLVVRDDSGTRNNDFEGDLRVAAVFPVASTDVDNWTPRFRERFGNGILNVSEVNAATGEGNRDKYSIFVQDDPGFDLGSGDYTFETNIRFRTLPADDDIYQIAGVWNEEDNERSWQFLLPGINTFDGRLTFRTSTDGQAGTIEIVESVPFNFELNRWYHVAVSRVSGVTRLFVDGVQQGIDNADSRTYHAANARLSIGAQEDETNISDDGGTGVDGFYDEVRFTVGFGRYTGNFAPPTAAFPRSSGGDPQFPNVQFLAGFDNATVDDESSFGRTVETTPANGLPLAELPNDGDASYQTVSQPDARDDTFVEAAFRFATGVLTLTGNAQDTETVTVDTDTYTFVTSLSSADDVLIGADIDETLNNLRAAIEAGAGEGSVYGTGTTGTASVVITDVVDEQMFIQAATQGAAGNSIATTETLTDGSFGASTLTGGEDIPGPVEFLLGRLPPDTTGVRSVTLITRGFKSDSGPADVATAFVTADGSSTSGPARPMTVSPSYREDVFEVDPSTGGDLTPSALIGARIRLSRTQ